MQDKDGKPVKLSDFTGQDRRAGLLGDLVRSLPVSHCPTPRKSLASSTPAKDVVVLAVNVWDKAEAFQAWLPKHPGVCGAELCTIDPNARIRSKSIATALYGVSGIPTQYVIDPRRQDYLKSIVGYEEGSTDLEDALKGI